MDLSLNKIDTEVQTSLESLEGETKQEAEEELKRLREDKSLLEGKIKGYLTLSEICHEYKEELKKLQQEYNKLLEKVNSQNTSMKAKLHPYSESPTPDTDPDLNKWTDLEQRTNKYDPRNTSHAINSINVGQVATDKTNTHINEQVRTSELFDKGPDPPKSSEGSKSIPLSMNDTNRQRETDLPNRDKFPMQESMVESQILDHSSISRASTRSESLTGLGFEHVNADNMVLGQSAGTSPRREGGDLMNFSLPRSKGQDTADVLDIENVLKAVNLDTEKSSEGQKVAAVVKNYTDKMSLKHDKLMSMNSVLIKKNNEQLRTIKSLEKEQPRFMAKIQKLEQEKYELSISRSKSPSESQGWVHVEKQSQGEVQKTNAGLQQSNTADTQKLHDQLKQLKDANQRWSDEWEKLQKHFETRIADLQTERDRLTREMTELKIDDDAKQRDYEKMLMVSKKKANDEESAKEQALLQLNTANHRFEAAQAQLAELTENVSTLRREKQAMETEMSVVRQRPVMVGTSSGAAAQSPTTMRPGRAQPELQTEIDVLRQQLLVFQEDFDRERQDRATAQSIKDDFKKQNDSLKKRVRHYEQKNTSLERQIRTAEENNRHTLQENERLQQELTEVKNQLQREREMSNEIRRTYAQNYVPSHPPIIQSAGIHPQQQFLGQNIPRPQQYTVPNMQQNRMQMPVQQYPGVPNYPLTSGAQHQQGPVQGSQYFQANQAGKETELLTGAWSCNQCTYVNYPGRTVCEMCGYIQNPNQNNFKYNGHSNETLRPRGDENQRQQHHQQYQQYNMRTPSQNDITTDTGNHAII